MKQAPQTTYRAATKDDINFVLSSWLQSFREDLDWDLPGFKVFYWLEPLIKLVLNRSQVLLATDPEDSTHLIGYVVYTKLPDQLVVHYIYTKAAFRRLGTARNLLKLLNPDQHSVLTTFTTKDARQLKNRYPHQHSKQLLETILL